MKENENDYVQLPQSFKTSRIISFINNKGGCLKTTLAFNLAKNFIRNGRSVSVVDFDQQNSIAKLIPEFCVLGVRASELKNFGGDYIIVDTGPTFTTQHIQLVSHSELVIVPCQMESMDVEQTVELLEAMKSLRMTEKIKLVIIHTGKHTVMYKLLRPTVEHMALEFGVEILCEIQKNQAVSQANMQHKSVFEAKTPPETREEYKAFFKGVGQCLAK